MGGVSVQAACCPQLDQIHEGLQMSIAIDIKRNSERYLELLRVLVEAESPTSDVSLCKALANRIVEWARGEGAEVKTVSGGHRGPHVVAKWPGIGVRNLVIMHYDTVWPAGTIKDWPFEKDGDIVRGPGVLDMKGGVAGFMLAVERIRALGLAFNGPTTALFTSDEELGSETSRDLLITEAQRHDRCYCLEPGVDPFSLRMERKGAGGYEIRFRGIPAHAGNAPEQGASAILEMARFALATEALNDFEQGVSVNIGTIEGGSTANVIPEYAAAEIDVRVWTSEQAEEVNAALVSYQPEDSRVSYVMKPVHSRPPLVPTSGNRALFEVAQRAASEIMRDLGWAAVGGGSDGSFTSQAGCPTLDGMGACGDGLHAAHEHLRLADSVDKAALLGLLLTSNNS